MRGMAVDGAGHASLAWAIGAWARPRLAVGERVHVEPIARRAWQYPPVTSPARWSAWAREERRPLRCGRTTRASRRACARWTRAPDSRVTRTAASPIARCRRSREWLRKAFRIEGARCRD